MQSKAPNFKICIWLTYKEYMLQFDLSLSLWKKLKKCKFVHLTVYFSILKYTHMLDNLTLNRNEVSTKENAPRICAEFVSPGFRICTLLLLALNLSAKNS
jgi:hypothetical protein